MYVLALIAFSCILKCALPTEYALAKVTPGAGEIFSIDIALDNSTMLTYPGKPDPPQECFKETVNFHDFEKRLVALKIVGKGKCLIKPSTETYQQIKQLVDDIHNGRSKPIEQATEEWGTPDVPIPSDQIEATVGSKIANFCTGYGVYLLKNGKVLNAVREIKRRADWCILCVWCQLRGR